MPYSAIGRSIPRGEGPAKVTGSATYAADILLPGMIWGKALRSPLPHARIRRIDTSQAERLPGVLAVLTARDMPDVLTGRVVYDMPILAKDLVRFIGEKVAVVGAEDPGVAEEALSLIDVEYEELPPVFDAEEAMVEGAPLLHPDYKSYRYAPQQYFSDVPNVHSHVTWEIGDIEQGFAAAARVFEFRFFAHRGHQGYLEPHASTVAIDPDGRVQVWTSNKMPVRARELLSDAIEVPQEKIVVHLIPIGGDFGGKGSLMDSTLCYHLARRTGRPVKMVMTYTEELMAGNPRHPTTVLLRIGVTRDAKIVAHTARVIFNSGAYAAFKPTPLVNIPGASQATGAYGIPNVRIDAFSVYTNCVPGGHVRAPGDPQVVFAMESAMDMMAEELGIDRLEFRRKNLLKSGDHLPDGLPLDFVKASETLEAALKASTWSKPKRGSNVGRGIALSYRDIGKGLNNVALQLDADGSLILTTPVPDTGTGALTVLRQIAAENLSIPVEQIRIGEVTTEPFKTDLGAGASRVTHTAGLAACEAAEELKSLLRSLAAEKYGCDPSRVEYRQGSCVMAGGREVPLTMKDLANAARDKGILLRVQKSHRGVQDSPVTAFTAQVVELAVDPETGQMTILDFVTAHDVGTIIHPLGHQGQIDGGFVQGLGFAMIEELRVEEGRVSTLSLGDYKLPNIKDLPPLKTVLVQDSHGPAPFQGKAIGESSNTPVPAAIANAVYDAVGVRFTSLPITAERIYEALKEKV